MVVPTNTEESSNRLEINGLAGLLAAAKNDPFPPVESWDPPYCGDIGLRIEADGTWLYRDSAINRVAMTRLFSRVLRCDADERHFLVTPVEKVDVAVVDAPFVAVEMDVSGSGSDQRLCFRTNLDDVVRCNSKHPLSFVTVAPDDGLKPYIMVRGRLKARVSRALLYDLVELAEARVINGVEVFGVMSEGVFFPLQP